MFEDKNIKCRECGADFVFSAQEQEFYAEKGFQNEPGRCPSCRAARKASSRGGDRQLFEVVCDSCGNQAQVPFRPTAGKPVYCSDCFSKRTGRY